MSSPSPATSSVPDALSIARTFDSRAVSAYPVNSTGPPASSTDR